MGNDSIPLTTVSTTDIDPVQTNETTSSDTAFLEVAGELARLPNGQSLTQFIPARLARPGTDGIVIRDPDNSSDSLDTIEFLAGTLKSSGVGILIVTLPERTELPEHVKAAYDAVGIDVVQLSRNQLAGEISNIRNNAPPDAKFAVFDTSLSVSGEQELLADLGGVPVLVFSNPDDIGPFSGGPGVYPASDGNPNLFTIV